MSRRRAIASILLAAIFLVGCGSRASSGFRASSIASGSTTGISFEVWGTEPAHVSMINNNVTVTFGANHLEIRDGKVRYNGKEFGAVKSGDKVVVDQAGAVLVNGQKREPAGSQSG